MTSQESTSQIYEMSLSESYVDANVNDCSRYIETSSLPENHSNYYTESDASVELDPNSSPRRNRKIIKRHGDHTTLTGLGTETFPVHDHFRSSFSGFEHDTLSHLIQSTANLRGLKAYKKESQSELVQFKTQDSHSDEPSQLHSNDKSNEHSEYGSSSNIERRAKSEATRADSNDSQAQLAISKTHQGHDQVYSHRETDSKTYQGSDQVSSHRETDSKNQVSSHREIDPKMHQGHDQVSSHRETDSKMHQDHNHVSSHRETDQSETQQGHDQVFIHRQTKTDTDTQKTIVAHDFSSDMDTLAKKPDNSWAGTTEAVKHNIYKNAIMETPYMIEAIVNVGSRYFQTGKLDYNEVKTQFGSSVKTLMIEGSIAFIKCRSSTSNLFKALEPIVCPLEFLPAPLHCLADIYALEDIIEVIKLLIEWLSGQVDGSTTCLNIITFLAKRLFSRMAAWAIGGVVATLIGTFAAGSIGALITSSLVCYAGGKLGKILLELLLKAIKHIIAFVRSLL